MIERLGFGGASLTSIGNVSVIMDLLRKAFDEGLTHYDTAAIYGKGYSEILYGKFLKDKRKNVSITTKFGYQTNLFYTSKLLLRPLLLLNQIRTNLKGELKKELDKQEILPTPYIKRVIAKQEIENSFLQSIKNLNTSYIDYFMLHEASPDFLTEEALQYLLQLKTKGDILNIGIANNIHFIKDYNAEQVKHWDVLQYEGYNKELKELVKHKFLDKIHFHHSILKKESYNDYKEKKIFEALQQNEHGKVIFATRNKARLYDTVEYIKHYAG
jgi:aryl-alcohol dehydrogenase-like predicted oxidoreductase